MFNVALGHSEDPDTEDAAADVINQCRSKLGGIVPQAGILLAAMDYDFSLALKKICNAFPNIQLMGCTSGGELSSALGYTEGSLLLVTFAADKIGMATAVARDVSKDVRAGVSQAIADAKKRLPAEPVLCLIFPDNFTVGTVRIVEEMQKLLGKDFPILGGGASGPKKFDETREFYAEEVLQDAVPMLFFSGPLHFSFSVVSGWEPFTNKKLIAKADKNIAYEIGEESALNFYKHYLNAPPTIAHPLAVFEEGQQRFYLRAPLQIDEQNETVIFGGDLPQQAMTSICQAEPEKLIKEVESLTSQVSPENNTAFGLVVSCACRQNILGTKTKEEYKVLNKALSPTFPLFGFYAYGQISPFAKDNPTFVHNDSIFILLVNEYEYK